MGWRLFFQLKCRDSNERKYSMHSWKAKHLLLKGKLWPRKRKRKKRKKEQVQLMGQTKVSWEIFKSTDEFSCTFLSIVYFSFLSLQFSLNMSFRGKSTWNNCRFFGEKRKKNAIEYNKNKCQHTLIFHCKNNTLENITKHCQWEQE